MNDRLKIDERESMFNALVKANWLWQSVVVAAGRFLGKCLAGCHLTSQSAGAAAVVEFHGSGSWDRQQPVFSLLSRTSWSAGSKNALRLALLWQPRSLAERKPFSPGALPVAQSGLAPPLFGSAGPSRLQRLPDTLNLRSTMMF